MSSNKLNKCSKLGLPLSLLNFTLFLLLNLFPPLLFLHLLLFQCNTQLLVLFLRKKKYYKTKRSRNDELSVERRSPEFQMYCLEISNQHI